MLGAFAAACGGDDTGESATPDDGGATTPAVVVNLTNWAVEPSLASVKAGMVSFTAKHAAAHGEEHGANEGGATHQLVVAPLEDGASVGEMKFGSPVLNLPDIEVGGEKSGVAELAPGRYELSCLVVEEVDGRTINHYTEGMYALLIVE
jgi:hypothetical protein